VEELVEGFEAGVGDVGFKGLLEERFVSGGEGVRGGRDGGEELGGGGDPGGKRGAGALHFPGVKDAGRGAGGAVEVFDELFEEAGVDVVAGGDLDAGERRLGQGVAGDEELGEVGEAGGVFEADGVRAGLQGDDGEVAPAARFGLGGAVLHRGQTAFGPDAVDVEVGGAGAGRSRSRMSIW
jgi:hypothetical protein